MLPCNATMFNTSILKTRFHGITRSASTRHWKVLGSLIGREASTRWSPQTAKHVKGCFYCCYVRCATLIIRVGGNALVPNWRNSLLCTVSTIKGLVVCYVVWLGSMVYGMGLWISVMCLGPVPCCGQDGFRAQVPRHIIDSCR